MDQETDYRTVRCSISCPNYHLKLSSGSWGSWCWGQRLPPRKVHEGDECYRDYAQEDINKIKERNHRQSSLQSRVLESDGSSCFFAGKDVSKDFPL